MAIFKSHMDETGIQWDDPYCTIAGHVGRCQEWERLEHDWRFVLAEFKVEYFHSLEFYGSDEKYKNWKPGKRKAFIKNLFDCLQHRDLRLVGSSIDVKLFRSLTEDERHYITGGHHNGMKWTSPGAPSKPYFVPFHNCIVQLVKHVPNGDLLYPVMSRQDQYKMKALELYDLMLKSDPPMNCRPKLAEDMVFSDPKKVPELQAADLVTYWLGRFMTYRAKSGDTRGINFPHRVELRRVFERLANWDDLKLFDFQGLMAVLTGVNRYIKTSILTRDQLLPSLPVAERKRILGVMRKASLCRFLDHWQPIAQGDHDRNEIAPFGYSEPVLLRWI
ncbi:MAG: DUF3800 domain-containing protein [Candidatus Korobacteraceae bacterium]